MPCPDFQECSGLCKDAKLALCLSFPPLPTFGFGRQELFLAAVWRGDGREAREVRTVGRSKVMGAALGTIPGALERTTHCMPPGILHVTACPSGSFLTRIPEEP